MDGTPLSALRGVPIEGVKLYSHRIRNCGNAITASGNRRSRVSNMAAAPAGCFQRSNSKSSDLKAISHRRERAFALEQACNLVRQGTPRRSSMRTVRIHR